MYIIHIAFEAEQTKGIQFRVVVDKRLVMKVSKLNIYIVLHADRYNFEAFTLRICSYFCRRPRKWEFIQRRDENERRQKVNHNKNS